MSSFSPPEAVRAAARRGLEMRRANNGKGGLDAKEASAQGIGSGVVRAQNLASGKSLPLETIKRMRSFFARHEKNKHGPNGKVAWALWGGDAGKRWADSIVAQEEKKMEKAMNAHQKKVAREVHGDEVSSSVPGHSEEETSSPGVPDSAVQANPRVLEQGHDTPMHDKVTNMKVQSLGEEEVALASQGLPVAHRSGGSTMAQQQFAAGSPGPGRLEGEYDSTHHIALVIARINSGVDSMLSMHKSEYDMQDDLIQVAQDGTLEKGRLGDMARRAGGAVAAGAKKLGQTTAGAALGAGLVATPVGVGAGTAAVNRVKAPAMKMAEHAVKETGGRLRAMQSAERRVGPGAGKVHADAQGKATAVVGGSGAKPMDKKKSEGGAAQPELQKGPKPTVKKLTKSIAEFLIDDAVGSRRGNIRRNYVDKFPNAVGVLEIQLEKALRGELRLDQINVTQQDIVEATKSITGRDLTKSVDHVLRRRAEDTLASRMDAPEDLLYVRNVMKRGW